MNYIGQALVAGPIADDIGDGHAILRQPAQQGDNPHIEAFADHLQFFTARAQ